MQKSSVQSLFSQIATFCLERRVKPLSALVDIHKWDPCSVSSPTPCFLNPSHPCQSFPDSLHRHVEQISNVIELVICFAAGLPSPALALRTPVFLSRRSRSFSRPGDPPRTSFSTPPPPFPPRSSLQNICICLTHYLLANLAQS